MSGCEWSSSETGALMPPPPSSLIGHLIALVGLPSWLSEGEAEYRLAREAYRAGWDAAYASHDLWVADHER